MKKQTRIILLALAVLLTLGVAGGLGAFALLRHREVVRYQRAVELAEKGNFADGRKALIECIRIDRNNEKAIVKLAELLERNQQYREAARYWRWASSLNLFEILYKEAEIRNIARSRNFPQLAEKIELLPQELRSKPEYVALLAFSKAKLGKNDQAAPLLRKLPDEYRRNSQLIAYIQLLDRISGRTVPEQLLLLRSFCESDDSLVAFDARLLSAERELLRDNFDAAEKLLKSAAQLNPGSGLLPLGDYYYMRRQFDNAYNAYHQAESHGIATRSAVFYGETLARLNKIDDLKILAKSFSNGPKAVLQTGYYLDALIAFSEKDLKRMNDNLLLVNNAFQTPVQLMMSLEGAIHQQDTIKVLALLRQINSTAELKHLYSYAVQLTMPFLATLFREGKTAAAEPIADFIRQEQPGAEQLLLTLISLQARLDRRELTAEEFDRVAAAHPKDPVVLGIGATAALYRQDFKKMLEFADRNLATGNKSLMVRFQRLTALDGLGRSAEAESGYRQLFLAEPDNREIARSWLLFVLRNGKKDFLLDYAKSLKKSTSAEIRKYGLFVDAELAFAGGDKKAAIARLTEAIDTMPELRENAPGDVALLYRAGFLLALCDANAEAIKVYRLIESVYPAPELIKLNLSELYAAQNQKEEALEAARSVWFNRQNWLPAQSCYGLRLVDSGRFNDAYQTLGELLHQKGVDPRVPVAWRKAATEVARNALELRMYDRAETVAGQLLKEDPNDQNGREILEKIRKIHSEKKKK